MTEPTTLIKDSKRIGDETDAIYNEAVFAATYLQEYLVHKRGNPNEVFSQFYKPFVALFIHTSVSREMSKAEYDGLINAIDAWMQKDIKRYRLYHLMHEGMTLFRKYQAAVVTSGAVVIKRE